MLYLLNWDCPAMICSLWWNVINIFICFLWFLLSIEFMFFLWNQYFFLFFLFLNRFSLWLLLRIIKIILMTFWKTNTLLYLILKYFLSQYNATYWLYLLRYGERDSIDWVKGTFPERFWYLWKNGTMVLI